MINRDEIVKLAREAGLAALLRDTQKTHEALERFAALIAQQEREACAAICDHFDHKHDTPEVRWCAEDIRARGSA